MNFSARILTDEEVNAEMNRSRGRTSEWPTALAEILASNKCDLSKAFGIRVTFPGRKNASVVAALRNVTKKNESYKGLTIRVTPDTEDTVNITNSVK